MFDPRPTTLDSDGIRLEPLSHHHAAELFVAGGSDDIWPYMPIPRPATLEDAHAWIGAALAAQRAGDELPFAIVVDGTAVGSTRYLDIQRAHRTLEIGWTWLTPASQRTGVNTRCKLMLLRHAFDDLGAVRVCLKTDGRNEVSQRAIERIGAIREGTLRKHRQFRSNFWRDTVYYSILDDEWPGVRERLEQMVRE